MRNFLILFLLFPLTVLAQSIQRNSATTNAVPWVPLAITNLEPNATVGNVFSVSNQVSGASGASLQFENFIGGTPYTNNILGGIAGFQFYNTGNGNFANIQGANFQGTNFTSLNGGQFTGNGGGLTNLNATSLTNTVKLAQSSAQNIFVYAVPAGVANLYEVGGFINTTAAVTDTTQMKVTFTDENNASQTDGMSAVLTGTGFNSVSSQTIMARGGTTITIQVALPTSSGSITYDAGAWIQQR